jgi:hypothetical protein
MTHEVSLRITFSPEIRNELDAATIFAEMGMNCEGATAVSCVVGTARVTQADLGDDFWEHRCTRGDLHMYDGESDE